MRDHIWDDIDGTLLACIKDGLVFRATDNRQIGTVRAGNLYSLDDELLGHLESLHGEGSDGNREIIPEAFRRLAKAKGP